MNLSDVNWDLNAAGSWPFPIKIVAIILVCIAVAGGGIYYDTLDRLTELENSEKKEKELKASFEEKHHKVVNLQEYRDQLKQIELSLTEMIRQMPTRAEVASLLVDITQTGLASGLHFLLFKPEAEVTRDFYSELPISIKVVGKFPELGLFVSGLASLPRIVTVHDVKIRPQEGEVLLMDATIKTYNENTQTQSEKKNNKRRKR